MMQRQASQMITRTSLHQELVDHLQLLIIGDGLAPGIKVPEKDLCARYLAITLLEHMDAKRASVVRCLETQEAEA